MCPLRGNRCSHLFYWNCLVKRYSNCISLGVALVAVLLICADRVRAYELNGGKWPQPGPCGANCLGSPVTLTYSFENMFDGGLKGPDNVPLPASLIRGSIEEALRIWASYAPLNFIEVPDDGLDYSTSTQYGQLRFRHIYINGPDPPDPAPPVAKAQAYFPPGPQYAGDVEFDHSDPWQASGTLHVPDVLGAAIHEIGHTLGLDHTNDSSANMYWIFHRFQGLGTSQLFPDDIAGIQAIYGVGHGTVTSLVPEPTSLLLMCFAPAAWLIGRRR